MKNILNISFGAWENEVYKKNTFYIPELAKKKNTLQNLLPYKPCAEKCQKKKNCVL